MNQVRNKEFSALLDEKVDQFIPSFSRNEKTTSYVS